MSDDTTKNTVYISNLSYKRDRNGLRSIFAPFGEIKNIKIVVEPATNQSRGMAFIEMADQTQALKAIEGLNLKIIDGRTAKVTQATPLRKGSTPFKTENKDNRDLEYVKKQLAKKARNETKRKSNPLVFKHPSKA